MPLHRCPFTHLPIYPFADFLIPAEKKKAVPVEIKYRYLAHSLRLVLTY